MYQAPPSFISSSVFSALPPALSIFDTLGSPAAQSADLAGLPGGSCSHDPQRRAVDTAPRGPEGNPVGRDTASGTWGQRGAPQAAGVDRKAEHSLWGRIGGDD